MKLFFLFLNRIWFPQINFKPCVFPRQVRTFYNQVLKEDERQRLCENMAGALKGAQLFIQKRMVSLCCFTLSWGTWRWRCVHCLRQPLLVQSGGSASDAAVRFHSRRVCSFACVQYLNASTCDEEEADKNERAGISSVFERGIENKRGKYKLFSHGIKWKVFV